MTERLVLSTPQKAHLQEALRLWIERKLPGQDNDLNNEFRIELAKFVWGVIPELSNAARKYFAVGIARFFLATYKGSEAMPDEELLKKALEGQYLRAQKTSTPEPTATIVMAAPDTLFDEVYVPSLRTMMPEPTRDGVTAVIRPPDVIEPDRDGELAGGKAKPRMPLGAWVGISVVALLLLGGGGTALWFAVNRGATVEVAQDPPPETGGNGEDANNNNGTPATTPDDKQKEPILPKAKDKDKEKDPLPPPMPKDKDKDKEKDPLPMPKDKDKEKDPLPPPMPKEKTPTEKFNEWYDASKAKVSDLKPGNALSKFSTRDAPLALGDPTKGSGSEISACLMYHHVLGIKDITKDSVERWIVFRHYSTKEGTAVWKKDPDLSSTPKELWTELGRDHTDPSKALDENGPKDKTWKANVALVEAALKELPDEVKRAPRILD